MLNSERFPAFSTLRAREKKWDRRFASDANLLFNYY